MREPFQEQIEARFGPTDPSPRADLTRFPLVRRMLRHRLFQFLLILPNQIIFWVVIVAGLFGAAIPTRNFSTVITWYIWFCAVFLLMVGVGRGWCVMCPFGGFAEWVQRRTFFKRLPYAVTLGRRWSRSMSRYGLIPSALLFVILTWFEEFYNIAGPGVPAYTSYLVFGVIGTALATFLIFERRTFCRYLCPLSALIGSVGATGMVAGFRTKNRDVCLSCRTKDCMRGSENGYGCPWYEWPGSATSNLTCGLCSECYKNCPYDNIGLFVQPPLTSVVKPVRRRWDIGVSILVLLGLVVFQQFNALGIYGVIDGGLNAAMHFPSYPNPVDYLGLIAVFGGAVALYAWGLHRAFVRHAPSSSGTVLAMAGGTGTGHPKGAVVDVRTAGRETYSEWLTAIAYGIIPLVGADYLARQLPRFFDHALRIIPAISNPFALGWNLFGTAHSSLYKVHLLSTPALIDVQCAVVALGTLGSLYATYRILSRDLSSASRHPRALLVTAGVFCIVIGVAMAWLYVLMGGAQ